MSKQIILKVSEDYREVDKYLLDRHIQNILLVCDRAISFLRIDGYFDNLPDRLGINVYKFMDFQPNPQYESVVEGGRIFREQNSDLIFAVGGGSAMDVAKCIKLYANMDSRQNYLKQTIIPNSVPLFAMPTTAGTGSEATRYAVIYYNGEKQSVSDNSCIPDVVLMDAAVLETLPLYQKKSTMLDALCHAIESFWSIHSTDESKTYAEEAIKLILSGMDAYLSNNDIGNTNMLYAAHLAGKAINITQTTAGHAMCYKLTSLYGIAHGHAAALCVNVLWPYMIKHTEKCIDSRGGRYLNEMFSQLSQITGCPDAYAAPRKFDSLLKQLEMPTPKIRNVNELEILIQSVNPVRLKNNPIGLSTEAIELLYRQIFQN